MSPPPCEESRLPCCIPPEENSVEQVPVASVGRSWLCRSAQSLCRPGGVQFGSQARPGLVYAVLFLRIILKSEKRVYKVGKEAVDGSATK